MESFPATYQPVASRNHTLVLLAIIVAETWVSAYRAPLARVQGVPHLGFSYVVMMAFEWLIVAYVVMGCRRQGVSLRALIGGRWNGARDFFRDLLVAIGFWFVTIFCLTAVRISMGLGSPSKSLRFMLPQSWAEMVLWILLSLTAGFCEEVIFRGYFQRQFMALVGKPVAGILLAGGLFGAAHAYQGGKQTVVLGVYGILLGDLAHRRKSLRPGMMVHAWQDSLAGIVGRFLSR